MDLLHKSQNISIQKIREGQILREESVSWVCLSISNQQFNIISSHGRLVILMLNKFPHSLIFFLHWQHFNYPHMSTIRCKSTQNKKMASESYSPPPTYCVSLGLAFLGDRRSWLHHSSLSQADCVAQELDELTVSLVPLMGADCVAEDPAVLTVLCSWPPIFSISYAFSPFLSPSGVSILLVELTLVSLFCLDHTDLTTSGQTSPENT